MGVLVLGSADAWTSAQAHINTSENLKKNYLTILGNSKHFSFFQQQQKQKTIEINR